MGKKNKKRQGAYLNTSNSQFNKNLTAESLDNTANQARILATQVAVKENAQLKSQVSGKPADKEKDLHIQGNIDFSGKIGGDANIKVENHINLAPVQEKIEISWDLLIQCVREKYIQNDKIKTSFGEAKEIKSCYINLAIVEEKEQKDKEKSLTKPQAERERLLNSFEELHGARVPILLKDFFKQNNKLLKRQLILGRAGIGKSVLCHYLAYHWAIKELWQDEPFKLLIWIPLRSLTNERLYPQKESISLEKIFYEQCKKQLQVHLVTENSLEEKQILHQLNQLILQHRSQILYLLDGFDEVATICQLDESKANGQTEIIRELLAQERTVITSRPYYIDNYLKSKGVTIDRRLENIGFTDENITNYIQRYSWTDPAQKEVLFDLFNKNPYLAGIAHIPINLALICHFWQANYMDMPASLNLTMLYEALVADLMYQRLGEQSGKGTIHFTDKSVSGILAHKEVQPVVAFLEKLAFLQMQDNTLIIKKQRMELLLNNTPKDWQGFESVLSAGLLVAADEHEHYIEERREHYFIHLTFQEFLAARYIAQVFKQEKEEQQVIEYIEKKKMLESINKKPLLNFIQQYKYNLRYEIMWWFVAGLLKTHPGLEKFFEYLLAEPRDLSQAFDHLLWIKCLEECALNTCFEEQLITELKQRFEVLLTVGVPLDEEPYSYYLDLWFEHLTSSPMVFEAMGLLQTKQELIKVQAVLKEASFLMESVVMGLISLIKDQDKKVRKLAMDILNRQWRLSKNALTQLIAYLQSEEKSIRKAALHSLVKKSLSQGAVNRLESLLTEDDREMQKAVLEILIEQNELSPTLINWILDALKDETKLISTLKLIKWQPLFPLEIITSVRDLLENEEPKIKAHALEVLREQRELSPTILEQIVNLLDSHDKDVKCKALDVLLLHAPLLERVINCLISLLQDEDPIIREETLKISAWRSDFSPLVVNCLLNLLEDKKEEIKELAYAALRHQLNPPQTIIDCAVNLLNSENEVLRETVLEIFSAGLKQAEKNINQVLALVKNEKVGLIEATLWILHSTRLLPACVSQIASLLNKDKANIRKLALLALSEEGELPEDIIMQIVSLLKDEIKEVRWAALEALACQIRLPENVVNQVLANFEIQADTWLIQSKVRFLSYHLDAIADSFWQSQSTSMSNLLIYLILKINFSGKNATYFETPQSLILTIGPQDKRVIVFVQEDFMKIFHHYLNVFLSWEDNAAYMQGREKYANKDYRGAIECYTMALILAPDDLSYYTARGWTKILAEDYQGAIEDASKIIARYPKGANAYRNRAWSYLFNTNIKYALRDVEQACQLQENCSETYVIWSLIYYQQRQLNEAIDYCQQAVSLNPKEGYALFVLAHLHRFQGDSAYQDELVAAQKLGDSQHLFTLLEKWMNAQTPSLEKINNQLATLSLENITTESISVTEQLSANSLIFSHPSESHQLSEDSIPINNKNALMISKQ